MDAPEAQSSPASLRDGNLAVDSPEFAAVLEEVIVWGVKRGWEILDGPANILMTDKAFGFTHPPDLGMPAVIHVNPLVLQDPNGPTLLKALILHELGHHLCHFRDPDYPDVFRKAKRQRLKGLLNLIEDEHLERQLRSMEAEWGECLDALVSWMFKGQTRRLKIEVFACLFGFGSVQEAARALEEGGCGKVLQYEWGYDIVSHPAEWISYPEILERIFAEIAQRHPSRKLTPDLVRAKRRLADEVEALRGWKGGIEKILFGHSSFGTGQAVADQMVRRTVGDMLPPTEAEKRDADRYIQRLETELAPILDQFPMLQRYIDEMHRVRHGKWFWTTQRTMLHALLKADDFRWAFEPALAMKPEQFAELFGEGYLENQPGTILRKLWDEWKPRARENRDRPLLVSVSWLKSLGLAHVKTLTRFMVSLRLGLGRSGAGEDEKCKRALEVVPKGLRHLGMWEVFDLTSEVAKIIGDETLDPKRESAGGGAAMIQRRVAVTLAVRVRLPVAVRAKGSQPAGTNPRAPKEPDRSRISWMRSSGSATL